MTYKNARGIIKTGDSAAAVRALRGHGDEQAAMERQEGMMTDYETMAAKYYDYWNDSMKMLEAQNARADKLAAQLAAANSRAEAAEAKAAEWEEAFNTQCARRVEEGAKLYTELTQLRAQLDAAEAWQWRPVTEKPQDGQRVELRTVEIATWDERREMWRIGDDAEMCCEWRPAPAAA